MTRSCDRRAFLARLGRAGLAVPSLPLLACGRDAGPEPMPVGVLDPVNRPILVPWSEGAYRMLAPLRETPMAYVSMARREVFVDLAYRDLASLVLDAHISVSTGLWRIRLPGDPPGEPITPGDALREFEEIDIERWDPTMTPAEGDFRILPGRPAPVRVDFACAPVGVTDDWLSAGPWEILRCDGVGEEACREDFGDIGTAVRHPLRGCAEPGDEVRLLSWACRG